jgi:hypothetical protein
MTRQRLLNRRPSETFRLECNGLAYVATVSRFESGAIAEIFINNAKAGSHSDSAAKDSAVVCSIALQYGVPLDVIRHALLRDARGNAASPLGAALDHLTQLGATQRAMKMQYDNRDRGALFKNDRKEGDNAPDYKGTLNVASAWVKVSKAGQKFLSISVNAKDPLPQSKQKSAREFDDEIPF